MKDLKKLIKIFADDFKNEWATMQAKDPNVKYLGAAAIAIIVASVFI